MFYWKNQIIKGKNNLKTQHFQKKKRKESIVIVYLLLFMIGDIITMNSYLNNL